eukprot:TRINITY_DN8197_c0_g1_i2.p1 TRINITY_DN8197_c0_g1~~TRINITY_DN8197_c0_g1_i2.p1  ORF type:complete len:149 (+),score=10.43 TRINITY_DN8197_c0_g1_i2:53-499(+)
MGLATSAKSAASILLLFLFDFVTEVKANFPPSSFVIASFNDSLNSWFSFHYLGDKTGQIYARIYSTALHLTPDTGNNRFSDIKFNSSFTLNSLRQDETGGEGLAFVVSNFRELPDIEFLPRGLEDIERLRESWQCLSSKPDSYSEYVS